MSSVRHLGRFHTIDGRPTGRIGDMAEKKEVARFPGNHVVAEREGEDLVVYQIGDEDGLGVLVDGVTTDRTPVRTVADLQRVYDQANGRRQTFQQRRDRQSAGEALADHARAPAR